MTPAAVRVLWSDSATDPGSVAALAAAFGLGCSVSVLPPGQEPAAPAPTKVIRLCQQLCADSLDLTLPVVALIETAGDPIERLRDAVGRAVQAEIYLSVSSRSAHELPIACHVAQAIDQRLGGGLGSEMVETALQEALVNALLHGNLEIASMSEASIVRFEEHARRIIEGLADPVRGARRIEVLVRFEEKQLVVEVADEGQGYEPPQTVSAPGLRPSGRGLAIIDAFASRWRIAESGRRLIMEFDR